MEWWDKMMVPIRRVWIGLATRLGIRKSGLLKLRHDIRTCEYEDVQVMWDMLQRTDHEMAGAGSNPTVNKKQKRPLWKIFVCASRSPCLCRSF